MMGNFFPSHVSGITTTVSNDSNLPRLCLSVSFYLMLALIYFFARIIRGYLCMEGENIT